MLSAFRSASPCIASVVEVCDPVFLGVDPWANPTPAITDAITTAGTVFLKFMISPSY
jgi:hypothetical protein